MKNPIASAAILLVLGLATPLVLSTTGCGEKLEEPRASKYHCPMHPQIVSPEPGKCPICHMDLVPIAQRTMPGMAEHADAPELPAGYAEVVLDPERRQLIGLRTVRAEIADLGEELRTSGRVAVDETRVHHVHVKYDAYVEGIGDIFTGKVVRKGDFLVDLYSPELLAAQEELLLAVRGRERLAESDVSGVAESGDALVSAARRRLELLDVSASAVANLLHGGRALRTIRIASPVSGYIVAKTAVHGMRVHPGETMFEIADLSEIWVIADLYEQDLPKVRPGTGAVVTFPYWPGREVRGRVSYVFPALDPSVRTARVRIDLTNPGNELRPEMLADVRIEAPGRRALTVPEDAVLDTGTRKIVFLDLGEGRIRAKEVSTGVRAGGRVEITAGLSAGEAVATGASFLVDSESRLAAAVGEAAGEAASGSAASGGRPAPPPAENGGRK